VRINVHNKIFKHIPAMIIEIPDKIQLTKLPPAAEMTIFLIGEELKNRKCMNTLEQVGFDTSFFSGDLGVLILSLSGFDVRSDELYSWYTELLDTHCATFTPNDGKAWKQAALDVYLELVNRKKL